MTRAVTADTSVVVPAFAPWHEDHPLARRALEQVERVPAHVAVEAVSVLTRLPGGYAVTVVEAVRMLRAFFPSAPLVLDAAQHLRLLDRLAEASIAGGRIYDALIGVTASEHGHELISLDERAGAIYRRLGVRARRPD